VRVDAALKEDQVRLRRLEEPWQVLAQQREIAVVALPHRHVHVEVRRLACREEVALAMLRVGLHAPVGGEDARAAVPLQVHAASPTQWEGAARGGLLFALSTLACLLRAGGVV